MSPRFENQLRTRRSVGLSIEDALAALLSKNSDQPKDEPDVAASIGAQLEHMELNSMPTSLRRRIRDIIARVQPKRVCEVGSGIGHLSAWLLDYWSSNSKPEHFDMIEAGGKFGVILTRLLRRYDAEEWAHVRVGDFESLCAELDSWKAANTTTDEVAATSMPPLRAPYEIIIVDVGDIGKVEAIQRSFNLLVPGGLILTDEPEVPVNDVGEIPDSGPINADQARVVAFNEWTQFITEINQTNPVGFVPLFGGTLVGIIQA
jgi:predicted O-methyltransferase YrrM